MHVRAPGVIFSRNGCEVQLCGDGTRDGHSDQFLAESWANDQSTACSSRVGQQQGADYCEVSASPESTAVRISDAHVAAMSPR